MSRLYQVTGGMFLRHGVLHLVCSMRHVPLFHRLGLFMVALCNRENIYIFILFLLLLLFFSSPNLSSRRLDVYHTSAHGVVLV